MVDDVVQDAFVAALENKGRPRSLRAWLSAVTRRKASFALRRENAIHRREARVARPMEAPDPGVTARRVESGRQLAAAVLALEERYRNPILLRYHEGLPPRTIAAQLDVPVETVRTRIKRGLAQLRSSLGASARDQRAVLLALASGPTTILTTTTGSALPLGQSLAVGVALAVVGALALWPSERGSRPSPGAPIQSATVARLDEPVPPPIPPADPTPPPQPPTPAPPPADVKQEQPPAAPTIQPPIPVTPTTPVSAVAESAPPKPKPKPAALPGIDFSKLNRERDLHGRVVQQDGTPIAGARVVAVSYPWREKHLYSREVWSRERVDGPETSTQPDGSFALRLEDPGETHLTVHAPGFAVGTIPQVGPGERLRIVVREAVQLVVHVKGAGDRIARGVRIGIHGLGKEERYIRTETTTDDTGRAVFRDLPAGWQVSVGLRGFHRGWKARRTLRVVLPSTGKLEANLVLASGYDLSGRVVDRHTRRPIAGARVGHSWFMTHPGQDYVLTDADGRYVIPGGLGRYRTHLHVFADGYAYARKAPRSSSVVNFGLERGLEVRGRVVAADGQPVEGARLSASAFAMGRESKTLVSLDSATTDAAGRFVLAGLAPGSAHELRIWARGRGAKLTRIEAQSADHPLDLGDITLAPTGVISALVHDVHGPLARVPVTLYPLEPGGVRSSFRYLAETRTDDLGRLRFMDLAPGAYVLRLATTPRIGHAGWPNFAPVVHVPATGGDVFAELTTGTRRVRARFLEEGGAPAAELPLHVSEYPYRHDLIGAGGRTDAEGWLRANVSAGAGARFSIATPTSSYARETHAASPERDEVVFTLRCTDVLAGRLLNPEGTPIADALIHVTGEGRDPLTLFTDKEGAFRRKLTLGGRVDLRFSGETQPDVVRPPKILALAVELRDVNADAQGLILRAHGVRTDRTLGVVVRGPEGLPLPDVSVRLVGLAGAKATDGDGRVTFEALPALPLQPVLNWTATEERPWLVAAIPPTVPNGQVIETSLVRGRPARGQLLLPDGTPSRGGTVYLRGVPPERPLEVPVNRTGRFLLVMPLDAESLLLRAKGVDQEGAIHEIVVGDWRSFPADSASIELFLPRR